MNLDLVKYDFLHWKSCYIQKFGVADKATSTLICESCSVQCRFDISNNLGFVYYLQLRMNLHAITDPSFIETFIKSHL